MADLKISALPASTTPLAGTEILPIVQSATTRQVSVANLTAGRAVSALSLTSTNDATINGVTVGRGGGNVGLNTAVGASALAATSTGDGNAAFGASALASNLAGTGNTATGFTSLRDNTSGNYNVASGYLALATNLSGNNNVGIGYSVLSTGTATSNNTAIGYEALKVTSGSTNTAIGYQSGIAMTTGTKNVILGSYSGNTGTLDIRTTNNNIVLSDGDGNVRAWWDNANARFYGTLLATGITNSALTSGRVTYAGASGVLQDSANLLYSGGDLTVYGVNVGRGASAVATNTVLGYVAGNANTTGNSNTYLGYGVSAGGAGTGSGNIGVGFNALNLNVGTSNTAVGAGINAVLASALESNTSGSYNTAIGAAALKSNTTADNNTAVGYQAGFTNSTGAKNVFIGQQAGKVSTGNFNTIIGNEAGLSLTTGTCNTFVGGYNNTVGGSGELVTSGSKNTILGVFTGNQGGLDIRTASNYIVLSDGDGNPRQIIDSSGNLGLGVNPASFATVKAIQLNTASTLMAFTSELNIGQNVYYNAGHKYITTGLATLYAQDSGIHKWFNAVSGTAGNNISLTQAMTLDASGNLMVGATSTSAVANKNIDVNGTGDAAFVLRVGGTTTSYLYSTAGQAILGTVGALPITFNPNGTERMRIASTGIVTMSAYGAGAATFDASGVISSVSDETWKIKDGVPINTDAMLQKLKPGYWFYNDEKKEIFSKDRQLGFYAQNVHEAIGEEAAPTPQEGKPWGYYDRSVLAIAVMSLKNALNTIEELKQRIATLESK